MRTFCYLIQLIDLKLDRRTYQTCFIYLRLSFAHIMSHTHTTFFQWLLHTIYSMMRCFSQIFDCCRCLHFYFYLHCHGTEMLPSRVCIEIYIQHIQLIIQNNNRKDMVYHMFASFLFYVVLFAHGTKVVRGEKVQISDYKFEF